MRRTLFSYSSFLFLLVCSCALKEQENKGRMVAKDLHGIDGPYIYNEGDSLTVLTVKQGLDFVYYVEKNIVKRDSTLKFTCKADNSDNDSFSFQLMQNYIIPGDEHIPQEKIFVTSDIEGNFNTFYSMLIGNKVMDENYNWTFGSGHLVIAGDMVDRGNNVMPCLWLLYKLEQEAEKSGGQVHYVLGNHDVMTLQLDIRYVRPKYIDLAKIISGETDEKLAYKYLMSNTNELIKWIKSKNTIEKIGNNLFVHGGISEEIVDAGLSIQQINGYVRKYIDKHLTKNPENDEYANLVFGKKGPLWYRGLVKDYKDYYKKMDYNGVKHILNFYKVDHIIIGHTIVEDEVTSDFNGKVIRVDIKHPKEKFTGKSQALLIEHGNYFKVNDRGERFELPIN